MEWESSEFQTLCHLGYADSVEVSYVDACFSQVTLDGEVIPTLMSYNCRGLHRSDCFNG